METPRRSEVTEKRRIKKKKATGNSLIVGADKHTRSFPPTSPVMELSKGLQASYCHLFFFLPLDSNENSEQSELTTSDPPQQKMWNVE